MIALVSHQGGPLISASAVPHSRVGTDLNTITWLQGVEKTLLFLNIIIIYPFREIWAALSGGMSVKAPSPLTSRDLGLCYCDRTSTETRSGQTTHTETDLCSTETDLCSNKLQRQTKVECLTRLPLPSPPGILVSATVLVVGSFCVPVL